jgi:hypothetical protein
MARPVWLAMAAAFVAVPPPAESCCPAPPSGKPVVNADQTVILLWDAATKTEHFIRKASFKSAADDFGFLIPSPNQPELAESGNEAFPILQKLTEPEVIKKPRPSGGGCGCATAPKATFEMVGGKVNVLDEKFVAGFHAVVLEASSAKDLTDWLRDHGYAYTPEVAAWAKPYVEAGWKLTALKVAKSSGEKDHKDVTASALRLSFKTDRPLFPYREPDSSVAAPAVGASHRLLRIYFLADARYRGELTTDASWTGRTSWAGRVSPPDRGKVLGLLGLPATTGPAEWWLTEFEDDWPYKPAPADIYFSRDPSQTEVRREPIIQYVSVRHPPDGSFYLLAAAVTFGPLFTRMRRLWV